MSASPGPNETSVNSSLLSTHFQNFQLGRDPQGLERILHSERPRLYDYLLRMTANSIACSEAIDQAENNCLEATVNNVEELRVFLYLSCRKSLASEWNGDVTSLKHPSYSLAENSPEQVPSSLEAVIDHHICHLPALERESLYLQLRCGFDRRDLAAITGIQEAGVDESLKTGLKTLTQKSGASEKDAASVVSQLPSFPEPVQFTARPTDLFELAKGIKHPSNDSISQRQLLWLISAAVLALLMATALTDLGQHLIFSVQTLLRLLPYHF